MPVLVLRQMSMRAMGANVSDQQKGSHFKLEPARLAIVLVNTLLVVAAALGLYFVSIVDGDLVVKLAAGAVMISGVAGVALAQFRQLTIQFDQEGVCRNSWIGKTHWKWNELEQIRSNSAGYELSFSDGSCIRILRSLISNDKDLGDFLASVKYAVD